MKTIACVTLVSLAIATPVAAQDELRAASAFGPSHLFAKDVWPAIIGKLEELTDGRYTARDYPSGLVAPPEVRTALRDGIVDMSSLLMPYFRSDFPNGAMPNELGIVGVSPWVISAASTEYIATCEDCQQEFRDGGVVYLGGGATQPYQILSRSDAMVELADVEGQRIRTLGGAFSGWAESLGAVTVQAPSTELYEMLSQGTVDGVHISLPELTNFQLYDVVSDITMVDFGVNLADCTPCLRAAIWEEMSLEDRRAFALAAEYGQAAAVAGWARLAVEARAKAEEGGIAFHKPSSELKERTDAFREEYLEALPDILTEAGVTDAKQKVSRMLTLVEKWEELFGSVDVTDHEAVVELRMEEIWDKVDFQTYGR